MIFSPIAAARTVLISLYGIGWAIFPLSGLSLAGSADMQQLADRQRELSVSLPAPRQERPKAGVVAAFMLSGTLTAGSDGVDAVIAAVQDWFDDAQRQYQAVVKKLSAARTAGAIKVNSKRAARPGMISRQLVTASTGATVKLAASDRKDDAGKMLRRRQLPAGGVPSPDLIGKRRLAQQQPGGSGPLDSATKWYDKSNKDLIDIMRKLSVGGNAGTAGESVREEKKRPPGQLPPVDGRRAVDLRKTPPGGPASGTGTTIWPFDWFSRANKDYDNVMRKLSRGKGDAGKLESAAGEADFVRKRQQQEKAREADLKRRAEQAARQRAAIEAEQAARRKQAEEKRLAEARAAAAKASADQLRRLKEARIAAEKLAAEAKSAADRAAAERAAAELRRKADAARLAEEKRLAAAKAAAEQAAAEARRKAEETRLAEAKRRGKAKLAAEQAAAEARRKAESLRRAAEDRRNAEVARLAEATRLAAAKSAAARAAAEAKGKADAARGAEERRLAEAKAAEEARKRAFADKIARAKREAERQMKFPLSDVEESAAGAIEMARKRIAKRKAAEKRTAKKTPPSRKVANGPSPGTRPAPGRRRPTIITSDPGSRPSPGRRPAPGRRTPTIITFDPGSRPGPVSRPGVVADTSKRRSYARRALCRSMAGTGVPLPGWYVVKKGDTLWRIAERHYSEGRSYRMIYHANRRRISDPDMIFPCQQFRLPLPEPAG